MISLCYSCKKCAFCEKPFPWDECNEYEHKITNQEILKLYWGMSETMQRSIYLIMEATQVEGKEKGSGVPILQKQGEIQNGK